MMTAEQYKLNEELMRAVEAFDIEAVKNCLERGADPNYTLHPDEDKSDGTMQPTTPLRMVMFRISDCDLPKEGFSQYKEIARLLLHHGADPKPAMQIAEHRYGEYDPTESNPFMDVWHVVAQWK
jgi:hypothetical protein